MKRFPLLLLFSALTIFSCTKTPTPPGDGETTVGSDMITPAGGVYDLGAVRLSVPEGAVDRDVEVRVEFSPAAPDPERFKDDKGVAVGLPGDALSMIEFGPDGVSFKEPVTVEFPAPACPAEEISVFYFDKDAGAWQLQRGVTVVGDRAHFKTSHFSTYIASQLGIAQLKKFPSYVDAGIAAGKSNEGIVADFHTYLLNGDDRDLFNEPRFIRGLWYTPMSSLCSGAWAVHADGLDSEPDYDVVEGRGEPFPENASFYGEQTILSYLSSYEKEDVFRKVIQETSLEEKRESQMKLYYTMFALYYRLAKPRLEASVSGSLDRKGAEATVTVTLDVPIPKTGQYAAYPGAELTVVSSDPSAVAVSASSITTNSDGEATFKITVLSDEASADVTVGFHKEKPLWKYDNGTSQDDVVDVTKVIPVNLEGEEWEAEFEIELEHKFHTTVDSYMGSLDNQYNFPDASYKLKFGGSLHMKVTRASGTNSQIYFDTTGETLSQEEWADLGVDPDGVTEYDKVSGTYSLSIDPSTDVTCDYQDRSCSWRNHYELQDELGVFFWNRDEYCNTSVSFSFSWPKNNSCSDVSFLSTARDAHKMTPIAFISEAGLSASDPSWIYEKALLQTRMHSVYSTTVRIVDNLLEESNTSSESKEYDEDGFLLVMGMYISLQEGTHTLSFEPSAAAVSGSLPEVFLAMAESEAPTPGDGAEGWLTTTDETHNASGTITIRKLSGQEEGE
ncbi:MAG: hypothetical protein IKP46_04720 [Bacteroidales bacterium]|nr:hypothetical protein [Bacteroidales bacterium]